MLGGRGERSPMNWPERGWSSWRWRFSRSLGDGERRLRDVLFMMPWGFDVRAYLESGAALLREVVERWAGFLNILDV